MDKTSPSLSFDTLRSGQVGISPVWGSFLAEAAFHCLQSNDHVHPVCLFITGDVCTPGTLAWRGLTAEENRSWADPDEAAEYGAYGVAILVALPLTGTLRVERSAKWGGFDYWLSKDDGERSIFQRAARMEVSGIFKGDKTKIAARLNRKLAQTKQSDNTGLPAYAVIVEFGCPEARFVKSAAETKC